MDTVEFNKRYIAARRSAIERDFMHLNGVQREAAMTTKGPLLLLAGAGSGKTTVLMNRIANLLKYGHGSDSEYVPDDATEDDLAFLEAYAYHPAAYGTQSGTNSEISSVNARGTLNAGNSDASDLLPDEQPACSRKRLVELCAVAPVEPWRIIAITFTNKAAGEMKNRLEDILGCGSQDVWAMTFHSACNRILRRDIDRLGYDRAYTIYDTADTASLMKRILKELDIDDKNFPHKTVLSYISRAKDAMITGHDFLSSAEKTGDFRRKIIGNAYVEYESRMRTSNSLDFDDLILLTVRLFMENPDILQHYQKRFMYVLVDEYQDTNNLQYLLASALAGGHGNICVVGDDDQSIYKFRGATIENILSFENRFADARVIRLEQNYRSTGLILDAANDVIRNNKGRKGKKLWTENEPGIKPELHITGDERLEAQFVADRITAGAAEGRNWQEHAVLYRMNAQSNQLETAFKRAGIPYRVYGGTGFYERAEIKDMLAYLCTIHNPQDDVRLLRIINNPPRGIGDTTIGRLAELSADKGLSIFSAIRESQKYEGLKSASGRLHQFADLIDGLRELSEKAPLDELYDELIDRTGYIKTLEEKSTDETLARIENVRELKTNIISFINENGGNLFDFLSETALYTDMDRDDTGTDRVLMMTMHSAKGLEFDTVFIVGAEEGLFPGSRSIGDPAEIEEERRLCYVAMTRAKRRLFLTSARQRMLFGKTSSAQPSRFIGEISAENIDVHDLIGSFCSYRFDTGIDSGSGFDYYFDEPSPRRSPDPVPDYRKYVSAPKYKSTRNQIPNNTFRTPLSTPDLKTGDTIEHTTFGRGLITDTTPGGGDVLLEIAFETSGTRRLLLKSAARYISKVN